MIAGFCKFIGDCHVLSLYTMYCMYYYQLYVQLKCVYGVSRIKQKLFIVIMVSRKKRANILVLFKATRSQSFKHKKISQLKRQHITLTLIKLNEQCRLQRKGYFHSTTSMHIFRTGFLRLRKSRARGGRSMGGLPGLRGGRFGAACCLPLPLAAAAAFALLLLLLVLLLLLMLLVVLMAVALSAVCQADDNGLPLGDVSQCTCAVTTTATENNDGQK